MEAEAIQKLIDLTLAGHSNEILNDRDISAAIVPTSCNLLSLEEYEHRPRQVRQTVKMQDQPSFLDYMKEFAEVSEYDPAVFVTAEEPPRVIAILDYHTLTTAGPDGAIESLPGWCRHQVHLRTEFSSPWHTWSIMDGRKMSQIDFAEFIETNALDIAKPEAAEVLEAVNDFTYKRNVTVQSVQSVQSGQMVIKYTEDQGHIGQMVFPERLSLALPVYLYDEAAVQLDVRIRYRVDKEGNLVLWYNRIHPDVVVQNRRALMMAEISSALGKTVYNGAP